MATLAFGTDGWRDLIADGFTVARVRRVARAYGQHLLDTGPGPVLVAHDTRFGGPLFQHAVAAVLREVGLPVRVHAGPLPTPALSFAVRELGAAGGVMLTASHNPAPYHGFKLKGPYGGSATSATYVDVAERALALSDEQDAGSWRGEPGRFDVREAYYRHLAGLLDLDVLAGWRGRLVHDAMHGAAAGWIAGFASWAGLSWRVEGHRDAPDPMFGGATPEPIPANLAALAERLAGADPLTALGVATDGDGDRVAIVPAAAAPLTSHALLALLVDHLDRRGTPGSVVKTVTVSRLVERLALARGREVRETPVGFKYLVEALLAGGVMVAGEESGGFGIAGHIPERDGILAALLSVEALAAGGSPLPARLAELERETGWRHAYDRVDLPLSGPVELGAVLRHLERDPASFAGLQVLSVERRDGVKLNLSDDRWVMLRASGTEPLLRVYAEGPDAAAVAELVTAARAFVARVAQPNSR
jgi:phosphomannomutase